MIKRNCLLKEEEYQNEKLELAKKDQKILSIKKEEKKDNLTLLKEKTALLQSNLNSKRFVVMVKPSTWKALRSWGFLLGIGGYLNSFIFFQNSRFSDSLVILDDLFSSEM